ncbi:MAG TPA: hypothetical protein VEL31_20885, partial [Ktedonobacteraceae bacterium]|nr:hypothetical protein [Ktedonobacteraceae bacterium]
MRTITYRDALREAIREEMLRDERVFILGEDIAGYGGTYAVTKGLFEEFGEKRVRDTPLAEEVITGAAIGAALGGLRPILELMTINFSLLATDLIVNSAASCATCLGDSRRCPWSYVLPEGVEHNVVHSTPKCSNPGMLIFLVSKWLCLPPLMMSRACLNRQCGTLILCSLSNMSCYTTSKAKCPTKVLSIPC